MLNQPNSRRRFDRLLSRGFVFSMRRAGWVIVLSLLTATAALHYTVNHLRINTFPGNVLSDELSWRQDKLAYENAFPQYRDSIVVVVDGDTPEQARQAADSLAESLGDDTRQLEWLFYPQGSAFFQQNGWLFAKPDELEALSTQLAKVQPFLAEVSDDPSIRGVFTLLGKAMREGKRANMALGDVFGHFSKALSDLREGRPARLSWTEWLAGKAGAQADRRVLFEVMPRIEYSSLAPGQALLNAIKTKAEAVTATNPGVAIRLTGGAALSMDELRSASIGAQMASVGSFAGVTLVMLLGLRSLWLVLAVQLGLVLGLIFTAAFAAFALGELNLISVAFSVMYIGIGADYAIYLCLRYRELALVTENHRRALKIAVWHVGGSLGISTLCTAIGFLCFIPTSYQGVAELGIISGAGMFISLIVTLAILPAMLSLHKPAPFLGRRFKPARLSARLVSLMALPLRHYRAVTAAAAVLAVLALGATGKVRFDSNPLNLQDPNAESVQTFRELLQTGGTSPWALAVLASDPAEAESLKQRLQTLPVVDKVLTVGDFVPPDQDDKLAIIESISLMLGNLTEAKPAKPQPTSAEGTALVQQLLADLSAYLARNPQAEDAQAGHSLQLELAQLAARLDALPDEAKRRLLGQVADSLVGNLPIQLKQLSQAMQAQAIGLADLPEDFRNRWVSAQGLQRVEIRPKEDLHDPEAMRRFVSQVRQIAPHATGLPVLFLESSDEVVRAFLQAFAYAVAAIILVLLFTLQNKVDVLLVLAPLLLASLLTGGIMALLGLHFNFANIIALPLVFGMGVDNCIHLVHRFRTSPPKDGLLLNTSTSLAVFLSALTNVSGFGNLSFSPHQGMASMGMVLSLGILVTLVCSMILLPSLLALVQHVGHRLGIRG